MPAPESADRRWWTSLVAITAAGLILRVVYVLAVSRSLSLGADATWYLLVGGSIREGFGFVDPETLFSSGETVATANFPPLYPMFLAAVQMVFGTSETVAHLAGASLGSVTVVLTALLARRLFDSRTALVAAALVAISPMLMAADGSLMSEALYVPLVTTSVLLALVAGTGGRWWAWVALGAAVGLAALTRTEALMLLVLLVLPVLWWSRLEWRRKLAGVLGAAALVALVVLPWVLRNDAALGEPTISTVSPATALAGSNCEETYSGASLGSWYFECTRPEDRTRLGEIAWADSLRSESIDYVKDNLGRLPVVLAARELRVWGFWGPRDLVQRDSEETRTEWFQWVVRLTGAFTFAAAVAGLWISRRRGREVVVLLAPVVMVAATALLSHGNPRFRTVAEPELLIAVSVAMMALWHMARGRRDPASWQT